MSVDLSGGIDPAREFMFPKQPDDPEMRESVNVWVWDEGSEVGLPRIGIEAVADQWDTHDVQVNIAFADGRVLNIFRPGEVHDTIAADGKARVFGAGPLSFELVEPFEHWRMRLTGLALDNHVDRQKAGGLPIGEPTVPVDLEIEVHSVVPPWENGMLLAEAGRVLAEQDEGALMGGPRYEQLFRMTGRLKVGDDERELRGGGLRIRRQGVRRLAKFRGHAWQSSVFPSGRGFGYIVYPPREDGLPTYNEGYVFDGEGGLTPARVVEAPWLTQLVHRGEPVRVVLETEDGRQETIVGESLVSAFSVIPGTADVTFPVLQQAIVRYTWDDESANGMMERSMPPEKLNLE